MDTECSLKCLGMTREGKERPTAPRPEDDFTLNDLLKLQNLQERPLADEKEETPSVIWTEASVKSTLASVIETEPSILSTDASVVSTLPSVASTVPSLLILEEVDLRYQCLCGTQMGLQEWVATREFAALYPSPYVCFSCRWALRGL